MGESVCSGIFAFAPEEERKKKKNRRVPLVKSTWQKRPHKKVPSVAEKPFVNTEREHAVARATLSVLKQFERLARSNDLKKPENIQKILERVQSATAPARDELAGSAQIDVQNIVSKTIDLFMEKSIDIPKIVLIPKGEVMTGYRDFDLDLKGIQLQPAATGDQTRYRSEARLEDYLVRGLVDFDDVSYDDHSELLYKLAGAVVKHLQSYLGSEEDVRNVLQFHQAQLVKIIHSPDAAPLRGQGDRIRGKCRKGLHDIQTKQLFRTFGGVPS